MKRKRNLNRYAMILAAMAATVTGIVPATPAWAERIDWRSGYRYGGHGGHGAPSYNRGSHIHGHVYSSGDRRFWGTLGVVIGASALYAAVQPRTVHRESRIIYPPPITLYAAPPSVTTYSTTTYMLPGPVPVGSGTFVSESYTVAPAGSPSPSAPAYAQPGPGDSGGQWWYACRQPSGYYPYVQECATGWEKVAAVPPTGSAPAYVPVPAPAPQIPPPPGLRYP